MTPELRTAIEERLREFEPQLSPDEQSLMMRMISPTPFAFAAMAQNDDTNTAVFIGIAFTRKAAHALVARWVAERKLTLGNWSEARGRFLTQTMQSGLWEIQVWHETFSLPETPPRTTSAPTDSHPTGETP